MLGKEAYERPGSISLFFVFWHRPCKFCLAELAQVLSAYLLSQQDVARAGIAKLWLRKALRQAPAAILTGLIHAQARSKARAVLGGLQELRGLHVCVRLSRMFSGPSWQFNFKTRSPVSLIMVHYILMCSRVPSIFRSSCPLWLQIGVIVSRGRNNKQSYAVRLMGPKELCCAAVHLFQFNY